MGHTLVSGKNDILHEKAYPLATVCEDVNLDDSCFFDMASEYSGNDFVMAGYSPTSYNGSSVIDTDSTIRHSDYMNAFESFDALSHHREIDKMFPMSGMCMFSSFEHGGDTFANRYSETAYDGDHKSNNALTLKLNSLTESVLKQLETPIMEAKSDPMEGEIGGIGEIDPRIIERLYNAGVNIGAIVSPNMSKNMGHTNAGLSCNTPPEDDDDDVDSASPSYGRRKNSALPHLDLNSKDSRAVHKNEDLSSDDKRSYGLHNKAAGGISNGGSGNGSGSGSGSGGRTTRRRPKKSEEGRQTTIQRGTSDLVVPNVPSKNGNSKFKSATKAYYTNVTPNWVKNAVLGNKCSANICAIAKDQAGCRMLQKLLESNDEAFIDAVLEGVIDNLVELMTDPFGNYLCQKLMSVCSESKLGKIIDSIGKEFIHVALNMHGTRALQKLIEVIRTPEHVIKITDVLNKGAVELVTDLNGNHVIQTCLSSLTSDECEVIYQTMYKHCVELATHRHGCCVMQRCIDAANDRQRKLLIEIITENVLELVEDAYGNYVIQYTLRIKNQEINTRIVKALAPRVTEFAKQKYSSNVIERCLMICPPETRSILISRFIDAPFEVIKDLILHPFGNYVIQRVLNVARPDEMAAILNRIQPHIDELKNASAGKRIAAKISKKHYHCNEKNYNMQDGSSRNDYGKTHDQRSSNITNGYNSPVHRSHKDANETRNAVNRRIIESSLSQHVNGNKVTPKKDSQLSNALRAASGRHHPDHLGVSGYNGLNASVCEYFEEDMRSTDTSTAEGSCRRDNARSLGLLDMLFTRKLTVGPETSALNVYANGAFGNVFMSKK